MPESDFERRLARLLRQTADDMPPELDVSARVHQRILSGGQHGGRGWMAVASMVAVVALLIGTLTWFHGTGPRTGGRTSVRPDSALIALHVDAAYADATATAITFHFTGPQADVVYIPEALYLTDAAGSSLHNLTEETLIPNGSYALFPPLTESELSGRQTLTLTAEEVDATPLHFTGPVAPTPTRLSGHWQVRFAVTPVAGTSTPLQAAAQTHDTLSMQPLRLDVAPNGPLLGGLYLPGGVRIVLRMSGLTPGSSQFPALATAYKDARGDGGPSAGSPSSLSAAAGPGVLPNFVIALDAQGRPEDMPGTVGADGVIEFELIYLHPSQGPLTLRFETIMLSTGESFRGPWVFAITSS